jgi:hypothetical protein
VTLAAAAGLEAKAIASAAPDPKPAAAAKEVVVHVGGLAKSALDEFEVWSDSAAAGGKLVGTPNGGGNLDPPPESDPSVTFKVKVQGGVPYRCWMRMKVGAPRGVSKANRVWVQFTGAVDAKGKETLKPGTASFLTAQGSAQPGWEWVACGASADAKAPATLVTFRNNGEVSVRVQAGMEGVGFDQFILSPARFLDKAPAEAVVEN